MDDLLSSQATVHQRVLDWLRTHTGEGLTILNVPYVYFASAARVIARDLGGLTVEEAQAALHALDGHGLLDFSLHRRRGTRIVLRAHDSGEDDSEALARIAPEPLEHELEALVTALQGLCEHVRETRPASARAIVRMTEQTIAELRTRPIERERIGALLTGIGFGAAGIPGIRTAWENATTAADAFGIRLHLYEMQRTLE